MKLIYFSIVMEAYNSRNKREMQEDSVKENILDKYGIQKCKTLVWMFEKDKKKRREKYVLEYFAANISCSCFCFHFLNLTFELFVWFIVLIEYCFE